MLLSIISATIVNASHDMEYNEEIKRWLCCSLLFFFFFGKSMWE